MTFRIGDAVTTDPVKRGRDSPFWMTVTGFDPGLSMVRCRFGTHGLSAGWFHEVGLKNLDDLSTTRPANPNITLSVRLRGVEFDISGQVPADGDGFEADTIKVKGVDIYPILCEFGCSKLIERLNAESDAALHEKQTGE